MAMTKKHFTELARIMKNTKPVSDDFALGEDYIVAITLWKVQLNELIVMCKRENAAFKSDFFKEACGLN